MMGIWAVIVCVRVPAFKPFLFGSVAVEVIVHVVPVRYPENVTVPPPSETVCEQGGVWRVRQKMLGFRAFLLGRLSSAAASLMPASASSSTALRATCVLASRVFDVAEEMTVTAETARTTEIPSASTSANPLSSARAPGRSLFGASPSGCCVLDVAASEPQVLDSPKLPPGESGRALSFVTLERGKGCARRKRPVVRNVLSRPLTGSGLAAQSP